MLKHKNNHSCAICNKPIKDKDKFFANGQGEYIHFHCVEGLRQLLCWLGYNVKES